MMIIARRGNVSLAIEQSRVSRGNGVQILPVEVVLFGVVHRLEPLLSSLDVHLASSHVANISNLGV